MNEPMVIIHGKSWKQSEIQENVDWSATQVWNRLKYDKNNNHEHCTICYWAIGVSEDSERGYGYNTTGNHWLCCECYQKFIQPKA